MSAFSMVLNNFHWDIFTCDEEEMREVSTDPYGYTDPDNLEVYIRVTDQDPAVLSRTIRQHISDMYLISYGYDSEKKREDVSRFISLFLPDILIDTENVMRSLREETLSFDDSETELLDVSSFASFIPSRERH